MASSGPEKRRRLVFSDYPELHGEPEPRLRPGPASAASRRRKGAPAQLDAPARAARGRALRGLASLALRAIPVRSVQKRLKRMPREYGLAPCLLIGVGFLLATSTILFSVAAMQGVPAHAQRAQEPAMLAAKMQPAVLGALAVEAANAAGGRARDEAEAAAPEPPKAEEASTAEPRELEEKEAAPEASEPARPAIEAADQKPRENLMRPPLPGLPLLPPLMGASSAALAIPKPAIPAAKTGGGAGTIAGSSILPPAAPVETPAPALENAALDAGQTPAMTYGAVGPALGVLGAPGNGDAAAPGAGEPAGNGAAPPPPSIEPAVEVDVPLISNIYFDTDIREALQDVGEQSGVPIVIGTDVQGFVSIELDEAPLEKALDLLLAGTGYVVKKTPDYYLIASSDPLSNSFRAVSETQLLNLVNITTSAAMNLLAKSLREYVEADLSGTMVSVTAPPDIMERILADLRRMDAPPRQVLLDVRVVVMETQSLSDIGVDWQFPTVTSGLFSSSAVHGTENFGVARWPWQIRIGLTPDGDMTNALMQSINLMVVNRDATVVASPQIVAQNGREAIISVRTEEFFEIITQGFVINSQLEKIDTGSLLKITPNIGNDGYITMTMMTEVSDVVARAENNLPIVTRRTVENVVRVKDGGTAIVAGLEDNRRRTDEHDVPMLGRMPFLGRLFNKTSHNSVNRQVSVFVTPRIIDELGRASDSDGAEVRAAAPNLVEKESFVEELRLSIGREKKRN